MSLDISSFTGRLNSLAHAGQTPYRENTRNGLKDNPVKNLNANKRNSDSTEARVSDPMSLSANHQVDYKVNPKTHEVSFTLSIASQGKSFDKFLEKIL